MTTATKRPQIEATETTAPRSNRGAWGFTSILLVIYVLNWADKAILGIAAQPLAEEFGLTTTQIGLMGTAFYAAFTITGFSAGLLHRKLTLKWAMFVLVAVWGIAMIAPVFALGGFLTVLISRILLGFGEGPAAALIMTGVYSWHPREKRGLPSSVTIATSSIASLVLAPTMAIVIANFGWRAAFLSLGILSFAWLVLWVTVWKDGPYATSGSREAPSTPAVEEPSVPWRTIFGTRTFIGGAIAMFAAYSITAAALTFAPSYFQLGLGFDQLTSGTLQAVVGITGLISLVGAGFAGDRLIAAGRSSRLARGVLPGVAMLIGGVLLAALFLLPPGGWGVVIFSLGYALAGLTIPVLNAGISEIAPAKQVSGTLAVFMGIMYFGALIAPTATGAIVDAAGGGAQGWGAAWLAFGALAVVGGCSTLLFFNPSKDALRTAHRAS